MNQRREIFDELKTLNSNLINEIILLMTART